VCIYH